MFQRLKDVMKDPNADSVSQRHTSVPNLPGHVQQQETQQSSSAPYTAATHGSASVSQYDHGRAQQQPQASSSRDNTRNPYKEPRVLGLHLEYPETVQESLHKAIDIIAIPGLSAYAPKTWYAYINGKDEGDGNICWLSDRTMLPAQVPDSRIMTYNWSSDYQGRDVSQGRLTGEADTMLDRIRINRQETKRAQRPIIFVCSCFGGLLLAKALVRALNRSHPDPGVKQIADYTVGIITLGTPFRGSWEFGYALAEARIAEAQASGREFSWELVQYLRKDKRGDADANGRPSPLDDVVQEFTEMIHHDQFKCPVINFYETRPAQYNSFSKSLPEGKKPKGFDNATGSAVTVPPASAVLDGVVQVGLDVRHNMLWKPNTPENDGFVRIPSRISRIARDASQTLRSKAENQEIASLTVPRIVAEYLDAKIYSTKQKHLFTEKRSSGTCLSHIQSNAFSAWRDQPRSTTLVCFGEPGVGKSIFFSVAVDNLRRLTQPPTSSAVAYIYFDYADLKHIPGTGTFLRSILKQLLMTSPIIPEGVSSLYNRLKADGTQPSETEAEEGIRDIAGVTPGKIFILLDALDECPTESSSGLLSALARLQQHARISVLVTSRVSDSLEPDFLGVSRMQISGTRNDMEQFIRENMGKVSPFLDRRVSDSVKAKIVAKILETSQGMQVIPKNSSTIDKRLSNYRFELARLQLYSLAGWKSNDDIMSALGTFKGPDLHRGIRPTSQVMQLYEEAYMRTLERINTIRDGNPELARRALAWVLYSPVPLSPTELVHALAIKPRNRTVGLHKSVLSGPYHIQDIAAICVGLLTVEGDSVRLAHFTTHQYLAKNISLVGAEAPTSDMLTYLVANLSLENQIARQHLQSLAVCCVAYLSLDDFNSGSCTDQALARRLQSFPFYRHAASYLSHYAQNFVSQGDEDALVIFVSFFGNDQKIRAASQVTRPLHLRSGFKLDYSAARGPLALHYATHHKLTEIAHFLLTQGGAIVSSALTPEALLTATDAANYTPLCWAAALDDDKLLELFLRYRAADPNHMSRDGPPILLAARRRGSRNAVQLLAPITRTGAVDAMYVAVANDNRWLVRHLINQGVDPHSEVKYPELVMEEHNAKASPAHRQYHSMLRQQKSKGNTTESPIRLAKRTGNSHMCQILGTQKEHHRVDRWEPYAPFK